MICLGIEGTAEKTGVGIVDGDGNISADDAANVLQKVLNETHIFSVNR